MPQRRAASTFSAKDLASPSDAPEPEPEASVDAPGLDTDANMPKIGGLIPQAVSKPVLSLEVETVPEEQKAAEVEARSRLWTQFASAVRGIFFQPSALWDWPLVPGGDGLLYDRWTLALAVQQNLRALTLVPDVFRTQADLVLVGLGGVVCGESTDVPDMNVIEDDLDRSDTAQTASVKSLRQDLETVLIVAVLKNQIRTNHCDEKTEKDGQTREKPLRPESVTALYKEIISGRHFPGEQDGAVHDWGTWAVVQPFFNHHATREALICLMHLAVDESLLEADQEDHGHSTRSGRPKRSRMRAGDFMQFFGRSRAVIRDQTVGNADRQAWLRSLEAVCPSSQKRAGEELHERMEHKNKSFPKKLSKTKTGSGQESVTNRLKNYHIGDWWRHHVLEFRRVERMEGVGVEVSVSEPSPDAQAVENPIFTLDDLKAGWPEIRRIPLQTAVQIMVLLFGQNWPRSSNLECSKFWKREDSSGLVDDSFQLFALLDDQHRENRMLRGEKIHEKYQKTTQLVKSDEDRRSARTHPLGRFVLMSHAQPCLTTL